MDLVVDGQNHNVTDKRAVKIVLWLIHRLDEITSERFQLTFDCAGNDVRAEIKTRERIDPALLC